MRGSTRRRTDARVDDVVVNEAHNAQEHDNSEGLLKRGDTGDPGRDQRDDDRPDKRNEFEESRDGPFRQLPPRTRCRRRQTLSLSSENVRVTAP